LYSDYGYTIRALLRRPLFASGTVLALALGIGANAAIFACVDAILLQPLPVARPGELAMVYSTFEASPGGRFALSFPNYRDYREANPVFSALLAFRTIPVRLSGNGGRPEVTIGEAVSSNYFAVLGVRSRLGRTFLPQEDRAPGGPRVVVLSDGLWHRRLGADPRVLGRAILLDGQPFTVVGVLPPRFHGLNVLLSSEIWIPVGAYDALVPSPPDGLSRRDLLLFSTVGRLRAGNTVRSAAAAMRALAARIDREHPIENEGQGVAVVPLARATIHPSLRQGFVLGSEALMALAGVLLLVACSNVANLLLGRAVERRKEIAVRIALGASRRRIALQLGAEGAVLAVAGGAFGVLLAGWGRELLWSLRPPLFPATIEQGIDARMLGFAFLLCTAIGMVFALLPLAQTRRIDLLSALKDERGAGRGAPRWLSLRHLLVSAQAVFSCFALAGAGIFLTSFRNALHVDPGYRTERLALASFDLGAQGYDEIRSREMQRRVIEQVAALPGVRGVALAERAMLDQRGTSRLRVDLDGQPAGKGPLVRVNSVSPGYFATMGIPLRSGRAFAGSDRGDTQRVAVVNQAMAERFWPGLPAVSQHFRLEGVDVAVVGTAGNCKYESIGQPDEPYLYLPLRQRPAAAVTLHVHTAADPAAVLATIHRSIQALDPELPLTMERTMAEMLERSLWAARAAAVLLSAFGLAALGLVGIGVYSTVALGVRDRRRELAIRAAVGARRSDLLRLLLRSSMLWIAWGILVGTLLAGLSLSRISILVIDLRQAALIGFTAAILLVLAVSFVATLVPLRRGISQEAASVLRET
jgi:predicted permease